MENFYFYPIIIPLGLISSYTDIKFNTIKNKHLLLSALAGIVVYLYFAINNRLAVNYHLLFLNLLTSVLLGFLFFYTDMWGAGDAKLFSVYSFLLPINNSIFPLPCLSLFANIFVISTFFIFIAYARLIAKEKMNILKRVLSRKAILNIVKAFVITFSVTWIIWPLKNKIILNSYFLNLLVFYLLFLGTNKIITKIQNKHLFFILITISGLLLRYCWQKDFFTFLTIATYFKVSLTFSLLFYILKEASDIVTMYNDTATDNNQTRGSAPARKRIPFAPFMLVGALAVNTNFISAIISMLKR